VFLIFKIFNSLFLNISIFKEFLFFIPLSVLLFFLYFVTGFFYGTGGRILGLMLAKWNSTS
jgi:hypothetical protein